MVTNSSTTMLGRMHGHCNKHIDDVISRVHVPRSQLCQSRRSSAGWLAECKGVSCTVRQGVTGRQRGGLHIRSINPPEKLMVTSEHSGTR